MTTDELVQELQRAAARTTTPAPFDLDPVLAGGERRLRSRRRRRMAAGGITAAGMAAAVVAGPAWLPGAPQDVAPATTLTADAVEPLTPEVQATLDELLQVMSIFARPQSPEDELPPAAIPPDSTSPFVNSTSRYLGEFDDAQIWVVVHDTGMVCHITWSAAEELMSNGCAGSVEDAMRALGIRLAFQGGDADEDRRWTWRLVPDGYEPTPAEAEVWTFPSANLAAAWVDEIPESDPYHPRNVDPIRL